MAGFEQQYVAFVHIETKTGGARRVDNWTTLVARTGDKSGLDGQNLLKGRAPSAPHGRLRVLTSMRLSRPAKSWIGVGGQPAMWISTGTTFATPPTQA
jgi:hypothetical protein